MSEKYQSVYEVLSMPLSLYMAYEKSKSDGKIDVSDIQFLMGPIMKLPAVITGAKESLVEFQSMNEQSRTLCMNRLCSEFDLSDDQLESKIEASVKWILATGELMGAFKKDK